MKAQDSRRRGDAIDCGWAGIRYTRAYLRLDVPPVGSLRTALVTLARVSPVMAREYAADGSWSAVPDAGLETWSASVVTAVDEPGAAPARIFELAAGRDLPSRFQLLLGPDWLALVADHAFGDGQTADMFLVQVLAQAAAATALPVPWQRVGSVRRDAVIAAGVTRNLGSLRWMLGQRAGLAGGTYGPMEPVEPHVIAVDVSDDGFMDRIREARDALYPGASAAALVTAGLRAGIAGALGEPRPGFECLFNTRGPRRSGRALWGNWSVGAFLHPADDYDPVSVGAALAEARQRGVAAFGLAAARAAGAGRPTEPGGPRGVLAEGRPRLTISYMPGRGLERTPGFVPGRTFVVTDSVPNGLDTLTFQIVESGGRIAVSTAFFPESWDRERVTSGVRSFLADGVGLLALREGQAR